MQYDAKQIEKKWQGFWDENNHLNHAKILQKIKNTS